MMWVSRHQAQNAADAGALAGALARGYDDFDDPPSPTGIATRSATEVADANLIWNERGTARRVLPGCPPGVTGQCVRVEVYRNGEYGSTPTADVVRSDPWRHQSRVLQRDGYAQVTGNGNATPCLARGRSRTMDFEQSLARR